MTTFVTTDQKTTRKTPPIDDVCNNTQKIGQKSQRARPPVTPTESSGTRLQCPWAVAGPGQASRRRTEPHISDTAPLCGGRRRDRRARLRCPWAMVGPGQASRRRTEPHVSDRAPPVWRAPEGSAAVPVGGGGVWLRCPRQQRHYRLPNFARNLSWSFFETPQKRCNSNVTNSMFEQVAGELRAKLMGGGRA